jgi:hypothetical protein
MCIVQEYKGDNGLPIHRSLVYTAVILDFISTFFISVDQIFSRTKDTNLVIEKIEIKSKIAAGLSHNHCSSMHI